MNDIDPQMLKGLVTLLLLHLVAEREDYGYALVVRLREAGFGEMAEGTVYPALARLEQAKRLDAYLVPSDKGPARKYYRLTAAGASNSIALVRLDPPDRPRRRAHSRRHLMTTDYLDAHRPARLDGCAGDRMAVATVFFAYRAPVKGLAAQARTAHYVFRYDIALDLLGIRRFTRRSRTAELRRSIADAAADGGVRAALSRLGDPKGIGARGDREAPHPGVGHGGIFAVVVGLAFQFAIVVGLDVLSRGVEKLAIPDASLKVSTFFLPGVTYDITTDHTGALDVMGTTYNSLYSWSPCSCSWWSPDRGERFRPGALAAHRA